MSGEGRAIFYRGVLFSLVGSGLWGFSGACSQFLYQHYGVTPSLITTFRMLGAGLFFLAVLAVRDRAVLRRMLSSWRSVARLAAFGFGLYGSQLGFVSAVEFTNAGTATTLQMTGNVFIMAYACLRARSLPNPREFLGLLAAVAATVLIATHGDLGSLSFPAAGLFWGLFTGVFIAVYVLTPKELGLFECYGSFAATGVAMLFGGLCAAAVAAVQTACGTPVFASLAGFDGVAWLALLGGVAFVGTFAAFALYLHGVAIVGSVKGGLLGVMEPVSASACAALWLGTAFTGWDWAGLALMVVMLVLITAPQREGEG